MAWSAPITATSNQTFTAAQFNTNIRDNLLASEINYAAIDDDGTYYVVATGTTALAGRRPNSFSVRLSVGQTTTSTTYTNLKTYGPSITCTTGTSALLFMSCEFGNNSATSYAAVGFAVSGATTIAATDNTAMEIDGRTAANYARLASYQRVSLTAGSNTFTMKYRQSGGTGQYNARHIAVLPF